jgi:outer membrane protein assembly factor BamB
MRLRLPFVPGIIATMNAPWFPWRSSTAALLSLFASLPVLAVAAAEEAPDVASIEGWDDLPPAAAGADDWPWWRGPTLDNHAATGQKPPLTWSEKENVLWRVALPGRGHASPCIVGNRIFVTAADLEQQSIFLLCLDRETGSTLWKSEIFRGPLPEIHSDNSHASATPACDGERVFVPYQTSNEVYLAAVDFAGTVVWRRPVAPYKSIQGHSSSPALHKSAVIVPADGSEGNKLTALHRKTGAVIWRASLTKSLESYASPLVMRVAGRDQAIVIGGIRTHSFDPDSGKLLWECEGPATYCAATAAFNEDTVFATGGYPEKCLLAIRADGTGDVTQTHLRWKSDSKAGYVPSPLLHAGSIYAVSDSGLMRCYDAASGRVVWEQALRAPFYSSPVLAGDRIYVFDRKGTGYVVKPGRQFDLLTMNKLSSGVFATPVILGDRIYLRTLGDFYCLGSPAATNRMPPGSR